jgi:hypothetical protein
MRCNRMGENAGRGEVLPFAQLSAVHHPSVRAADPSNSLPFTPLPFSPLPPSPFLTARPLSSFVVFQRSLWFKHHSVQ